MLKKFTQAVQTLRDLGLDGQGPGILLAVSGGIDSMCMAELFQSSQDRIPFAIAHCDFRLRGEESDGDRNLVLEWASKRGVPVHIKAFDTKQYASEKGISIEMAARELRYGWFLQLCRDFGYVALSVAHNANDNAETLILNMLRGSGLSGLSGMSCLSNVPGSSLPLLRPLIGCTRKEIEGYVLAHKVQYRVDSTNLSSDYKRNRIRNEVFPLFEIINPSFIRTLNREMGYFSEAAQIVNDWCETRAENVSVQPDGGELLKISLEGLKAEKHWRYLLYDLLEPYGFNSATLASLENLIVSDRTFSGKRFDSPDYVLLTDRDCLKVFREGDVQTREGYRQISGPVTSEVVMAVRGKGTYCFNGRTFIVEILQMTDDFPLRQEPGTLIMDADRLRFPFVLRRWRSGDWLVPFGMRGRKKVSDMFADLKYDVIAKEKAVMIVDTMTEGLAESQHLAAVAGVRIDDRYKISDRTRTVLRISEHNK